MTQRNFFVNYGLECGDIVISATTNTITGLSTAAPTADGDVSNKKYVDDQASASLVFTNKTFDANGTGNSISNIEVADLAAGVLDTDLSIVAGTDTTLASAKAIKAYVDGEISSLSTTTISEGDSSVDVDDGAGGAGQVIVNVDGNNELVINDTSATFSGNVVVTGDFTVNGTTTTVNSTNTTLDDNLLELNSGAASNANDSGIIIERGSTGDNAIFMWDESADKFTLGTTTATASSTGNITITTGILVASTFEGNLTGNADTATEATNVTITANNTANETVYLTFVDGATGTQGIETDTNLSYNPSTNVLSTTASSAQYADLAEMYVTKGMMDGNPHPVGTVMYVPEDINREAMPGCMPLEPAGAGKIPVGTISENPAFLMNNQLETAQPIALKGRVPVRVIGPCMAGQPLYVADGGVASINDAGQSSIHIVGIALTSKDTEEEELVECVLKV